MRTTVTLDSDLEAGLRGLASQRRISFKSAINTAVRAGLATEMSQKRPYREKSRDLGVQSGVDLTNALEIAAAFDEEAAISKIAFRK